MALPTKSNRRRRKSQPQDPLRPTLTQILGKSKRKRKSRAKFTALQRLRRKVFRSAIAFLKRKGLASKKIDARKVRSTSGLRKLVKKNRPIIERKARVWKLPTNLPPHELARLKASLVAAGYQVTGRKGSEKLVLPNSQYFRAPGRKRKAKQKEKATGIYQRPVGERRGGEVVRIRLTADFEQQIREQFAKLEKDEWIGFTIDGHNSHNIYQSADGMINDLRRYDAVWFAQVSYLTVFRTKHPLEYLRARRKEMDEREVEYKRRAYERKKERMKVARQGMRVNR